MEASLKLKDRILFMDGDSVILNKDYLYNKLLNGNSLDGLFVNYIDSEIKNYNNLAKAKKLGTKKVTKIFDTSWNIPELYKNINIKKYVFSKLENEFKQHNFNKNEIEMRIDRVSEEYLLWKNNNLLDLLKTIIFIVDKFEENNIVWGTGRGSSCCSYILYLIGLHEVDSVKYELDIKEFFR